MIMQKNSTIYSLENMADNSNDNNETKEEVVAHTYVRKYSRYGKNKTNQHGDECIKEGYLLKQHGSFQRWRPRYFKLYPQQVFYAKSPTSSLFHEIDIWQVSTAETSVNNVNNSFKVITGEITLSLSTETRREMEEWLSSFKLASRRQSKMTNERAETLNGDHHWYSCTHVRPTVCNVCRDPLPGVTAKGLSCEVCRFKAHKKCASKAARNCKWTTLECIPAEDRLPAVGGSEEFSMPHQWLEGNILPGLRCVVCSKLCGNKRRLQDWTCLWCNNAVHSGCKSQYNQKCCLGLNCLSIIPPIAIKRAEHLGPGYWQTIHPAHRSPLLVFVNSKSGDNQGVGFMRRFKQLLNPAQVFDLSVAGPTLGVSMGKNFESFRILVCGGDGSVGWVMTELDKQNLTSKCQIGVLPLGTGNDLARVFRWGSACYDVNIIPLALQQLERARHCMLDRWGIMVKEFPSGRPEDDNILGYEDSIAMHITRMLASNQHDVVIQSAQFLCETIKDFVQLVGVASSDTTETESPDSLSTKCMTLQHKLSLLLRTLQIESEASILFKNLKAHRRSSTFENLETAQEGHLKTTAAETKKSKWHSDSELDSEDKCPSELPFQHKKSKQKVFIPKEHLWSRANSLKKAMKEIIDHTEKAVDEQNHQTTKAIAHNIITTKGNMSLCQMLDDLPESLIDSDEKDNSNEKHKKKQSSYVELKIDGSKESDLLKATVKHESSEKLSPEHSPPVGISNFEVDLLLSKAISKISSSDPTNLGEESDDKIGNTKRTRPFNSVSTPASPFYNMKSDFYFGGGGGKTKSSNTVTYPGTVIAKAFQKQPKVSEGIISKVLLANASAFCATALPGVDEQDKLKNYKEKCVMNSYFGVGIDAKITLDFHNKREEHPEKCRSRTRNFIWYGVLGGKELINRTHRNLEQNVHLEVDGHNIDLPSLQGIVVLNIPSYMGGSNFWGTKKEMDGFVAPSFDDKMLEVVAVLGASQMGMSKVFGGMQHHRISQCHTVKITITDEAVPVQVDGEAWMQPPGIVQIVHKNRAPMLMRDRDFEETLRSWNALKQCKSHLASDPLNEQDMTLLQPVVSAVIGLVRSVKAASMMNSVVQQELYQMASNLATLTERLQFHASSPGSAESVSFTIGENTRSQGEVNEFIALGKSFISEVNEKMWTLKPEFSPELENRIVASLSSADQHMTAYCDHVNKQDFSFDDANMASSSRTSEFPNRKGSLASAKSWNLFSRKAASCREPRLSESKDQLEAKSILEWGVIEVGIWLDRIGCGEYKTSFIQHDIRGPELVALERHDLAELGICKVGHTKRILEKVKQLQKNGNIPKASKWTRKTVS